MFSIFQKIKLFFPAMVLISGLGAAIVVSSSASAMPRASHAAFADFNKDACSGVNQVGGGSGCGSNPSSTIAKLMKSVLTILSVIVGFAAIVMVIVSGFRFITANGDSSSIASARSSLIYALVGVVIAVFAQVIVRFVLGKVGGIGPQK